MRTRIDHLIIGTATLEQGETFVAENRPPYLVAHIETPEGRKELRSDVGVSVAERL